MILSDNFYRLDKHDNIMPGVTKRKLHADATTAAGASSKKVRPSNAPAKKVQKKPAPPPESESGDDDDASERDSTDAQEDQDAVGDVSSNAEAGPSTTADATSEEAQPSTNEPKKTFADLGVREELCDAVENLKYVHPTPIQEQAIPLALQGRDVIGLAETGSGKTAAFVLPILQSLLEKPQPLFGLILAPTRELAYQIAQQVDALGSIINVKCATLVGGMDMVPQAISLSKKPHIVVATPGRLLDREWYSYELHVRHLLTIRTLRSGKHQGLQPEASEVHGPRRSRSPARPRFRPRTRQDLEGTSSGRTTHIPILCDHVLQSRESSTRRPTKPRPCEHQQLFAPGRIDLTPTLHLPPLQVEGSLPHPPPQRQHRPPHHHLHPHSQRNTTYLHPPPHPRLRRHPATRSARPVRPSGCPQQIQVKEPRHPRRYRRRSPRSRYPRR